MEPALQAGLAGDAKTLQGDVGGILELRERQQRIAVDHGQLQQGRAVSCGPSQSPSSLEAGEPLRLPAHGGRRRLRCWPGCGESGPLPRLLRRSSAAPCSVGAAAGKRDAGDWPFLHHVTAGPIGHGGGRAVVRFAWGNQARVLTNASSSDGIWSHQIRRVGSRFGYEPGGRLGNPWGWDDLV
jgi:hypothetical protein